jgi:cell division septum initiation protein DivIVA
MSISKLRQYIEKELVDRKLLADGLEMLKSLESSVNEHSELLNGIEKLKAKNALLEKQVAEQADSIAKAKAEADNIVESAFKQAEQIRETASKDAALTIEAALVKKAKAQSDLEDILLATQKAQSEKADVQMELDALNKEMQSIKAKLKNLVE